MMESGAFRELYDSYYPDVLRFVQSLLGRRAHDADVDDIVQTVFVKVALAVDTFRGESKWKTWLFAIARNAVRDFARQAARSAHRAGQSLSVDDGETRIYLSPDAPAYAAALFDAASFADPASDPESAALRSDERARVRACIDRLPEAMRAVVVCRLVCDLSVSETADVLDWTSARVRVTYSRALRKFQSIWESEEASPAGRSRVKNHNTATTSSK